MTLLVLPGGSWVNLSCSVVPFDLLRRANQWWLSAICACNYQGTSLELCLESLAWPGKDRGWSCNLQSVVTSHYDDTRSAVSVTFHCWSICVGCYFSWLWVQDIGEGLAPLNIRWVALFCVRSFSLARYSLPVFLRSRKRGLPRSWFRRWFSMIP